MHFTGRTWRPPYEANSVIIQATSGCTYGKCRFCSLYKDECFRMSPMEEFEEDLAEIKSYQPYARRIFWTGANPFAMSYENLKLRALTVRDYLIKCQTMAMFASIRDIKSKEVWQLKKLRAMGINGLTIGTESGDDGTLELAGKGYTAADILEQCRKLDEAGIEYYFVYMTGLAGKGRGYWNAVNSAELFSRLNPYFISGDSLTCSRIRSCTVWSRRGSLPLPAKKSVWRNCRCSSKICRYGRTFLPTPVQTFTRSPPICQRIGIL